MSETSTCPACLKKIRKDSKFCKFCGIPLKICPKCKEHNKVEDAFCGSCGEDIKDVQVESPVSVKVQQSQEPQTNKQPQLVIWPPIDQRRVYGPPAVVQKPQLIPDGVRYEPPLTKYPYDKIRPFGYIGGPIPETNVISPALESFGYALALITIGVIIVSIGLAFYQLFIPPILTGILGGALILSGPFFGIYYVTSSWLYKMFQIKRPVKVSTIILNYGLGTLLFSVIGLACSPLLLLDYFFGINPAIGTTIFSIIAALIYFIGLIIIPLKAYLADLTYVKSAMNQREKEEKDSEKQDKKQEDEEKEKIIIE